MSFLLISSNGIISSLNYLILSELNKFTLSISYWLNKLWLILEEKDKEVAKDDEWEFIDNLERSYSGATNDVTDDLIMNLLKCTKESITYCIMMLLRLRFNRFDILNMTVRWALVNVYVECY